MTGEIILRAIRRVVPAVMAALVVGLSLPAGATPVRADTHRPAPGRARATPPAARRHQLSAGLRHRALNNAEDSFNAATAALNSERAQLAMLNSELATLQGQITADQAQEAAARSALSTLTRATYESVSGTR